MDYKIGKDIAFLCKICDISTLFQIDYLLEYPEGGKGGAPAQCILIHCKTCEQPIILNRFFDLSVGDFGDLLIQVPGENVIPAFYNNLPPIVMESYDEAVKCKVAKINIACATMIGRTLEAVFKQQESSAKTINDGIQILYAKGVLSQELVDWSNSLRILRNISAHPTDVKIISSDILYAFEFLTAILDILYHLRPLFNKMKKNQEDQKKKDESPKTLNSY